MAGKYDKFIQPADGIEVTHVDGPDQLLSSDIFRQANARIAAGEDRDQVVTDLAMEIVDLEDGLLPEPEIPEDVLRAAGDVAGHEFHGNQWTDGGISSSGEISKAHLDERFSRAGAVVDGRTVLDEIPNQDSIGASLTDYEVLPGVREVKMSELSTDKPSFYSASEERRTQALAEAIKESGEIKPLIVVFDGHKDGSMYVLEGGHRYDALRLIGAKSFPALVVIDTEKLRVAAAYRDSNPLHAAADLHAPKIEVAIRYAFAMGRKAIQGSLRTAGDVEGHEFHGNQYVGSGSGQIKDKSGKAYDVSFDESTRTYSVKDPYIRPGTSRPSPVGSATMKRNYTAVMSIGVHGEYQRKGIATALYKHIETHIGRKLVPNWALTPDGEALWKSRGAEASLADRAAAAVRLALTKVLRPTLLKAMIAGGEAGLAMLGKMRAAGDVEGHPFHGNQWTEGGTVFHGTAKENLDSILRDGIKPGSGWRATEGEHVGKVFVATELKSAGVYAESATGQPNGVIFEVHVPPDSSLAATGLSGGRFLTIDHVKPEWIKAVYARKGPAAKGKKIEWKKIRSLAATSKPLYIVVFLGPDERDEGLRTARDHAAKKIGLAQMRFDAKNERAASWADRHAVELIDGITETTREAIANAVAAAQEDGDLDEMYDEILAAVGDETRASLIARTESMTAANAGQREGWQQAVDEGLLPENAVRSWIATSDACAECEALDGQTADLDGEYPDEGGEGPPLHPNCRCTEGIVGFGG